MKWLLFESFRLAQNHKMDVVIIAKMLRSQGEDVSIFDIYHDYSEDFVDDIPILHWSTDVKVPDISWMKEQNTIFHSMMKGFQYNYQVYRYMKEVKDFIIDKADCFYCGSFHNKMTTVLFEINKPCFWWGLRSDRFHFTLKKILKSPYTAFSLLFERQKFLANPKQYLFVSNNFILNEHVEVGIPGNRMVIREERCIENMPTPQFELLNKKFTFLTIGQLRPDKRIDYTIKEFKKVSGTCQYVLAGRAQDSYEDIISQSINGSCNIIRVNCFLDYSDFNLFIKQSQFVVLADRQQAGSVTNGTLIESFINFRPVIAPNYNPYKFYIEKYHIGILYDPSIPGDLARAMQCAKDKGCFYYEINIREFLKTIEFDMLATRMFQDLRELNVV